MRLALPLLIALSACTQFPELEGTVAPDQMDAPFPGFIPLAPLLAQAEIAQAGATNTAGATVAAGLSPRIDNLRARGARLRGPVIAPPVRTRMLRGVR